MGRYRPYLVRLLVVSGISLVLVAAINEGAYLFQKERHERPPQTIQLVIPAGTSERVAAGDAPVSLPQGMVFMIGDTLEVKNEDLVDHQLGPIWVPPGSTGRLVLEEANQYSYSCSFTPSQYLGLDVRPPTTLATRLTGLGIALPPTIVFLFIYSLLVFPVDGSKKTTPEVKKS